jgi:hypothetical protein
MSPGMFSPFEGELEVGLTVRYWPRGQYNPGGTPRIGIITKVWSKSMVNLAVLPESDGIVEDMPDVFYIGDPRVFDGHGNLSEAVKRKGMWELTELSKFFLDMSGRFNKAKPEKAKAEKAKV